MSSRFIIKGLTIYTEDHLVQNGFLVVEDGAIVQVGTQGTDTKGYEELEFPQSFALVPGMIDVHIHGANGADVMDASQEALETIAAALPGEGTTGFLATTMTQERAAIEAALQNAGKYMKAQPASGSAEMLGVHLEGPFINAKRAGAQPLSCIAQPDTELFRKWQSLAGGSIRIVTLAPEEEGGLTMTRYLKEQGIIASIGHSDATYEQTVQAIEAGASHVTHLFNGMRGLHHREPGLLGAALIRDELTAELIVDGIHVHPEMVKLTLRQKQADKLLLITDAMRAKCLKNGMYKLGGQDVQVEDGRATLHDGTLAGSVLPMNQALRNMMSYTDCSLQDVIQMGAVNPAKRLGIFDRKGSIAPGKDADLVVLDENQEVVMTWCRGELAYKRGSL